MQANNKYISFFPQIIAVTQHVLPPNAAQVDRRLICGVYGETHTLNLVCCEHLNLFNTYVWEYCRFAHGFCTVVIIVSETRGLVASLFVVNAVWERWLEPTLVKARYTRPLSSIHGTSKTVPKRHAVSYGLLRSTHAVHTHIHTHTHITVILYRGVVYFICIMRRHHVKWNCKYFRSLRTIYF